MNRQFRNAVSCTIAIGLMAGAALAQSAAEGAIKARKAQMDLQAFNLGPLVAMAKGELPYDAAQADAAAKNLAALASMNVTAYFPEGSAQGQAEGTRSLPAVWENMADFGVKHEAAATAATALAEAAGKDIDSLRAAIGPMGQACGACHQTYRATE